MLEPERVPFISYPYEWSFGQLRDAALLTLDLQERALARGLTLRDASAYNVQFVAGRPLFIDTLSFEPREPGAPWAGYRQFCEHFLVPLALMSRVDVRLSALLLRSHLEGIPLDLGSRLLPRGTWLRPGLLFHVHLHAMAQRRYADRGSGAVERGEPSAATRRGVSPAAATGLVRSLRGAVQSLDWTPAGTEWADYTAGQQLLQRGRRLQAAGGDRVPSRAGGPYRVGPGRQHRRIQPGRAAGGPQRDRVRHRSRRGRAELPPGQGRERDRHPAAAARPHQPLAGARLGPSRAAEPGGARSGGRAARARRGAPPRDRAQPAARAGRGLPRQGGTEPHHRVRAQERLAGAPAPARSARHLPGLHQGRLRGGVPRPLPHRARGAGGGIGAHALPDDRAALAATHDRPGWPGPTPSSSRSSPSSTTPRTIPTSTGWGPGLPAGRHDGGLRRGVRARRRSPCAAGPRRHWPPSSRCSAWGGSSATAGSRGS